MSAHFPWGLLGIAETSDRKAIRSAYAERLKALDVDANVAAFAELREAREEALYLAAHPEADNSGLGPALADDAASPDTEWDAPLTADELLPPDTVRPVDYGDAPASEVEPQDERPDRLLALLYPGNDHSGDSMTPEEFAEAEALQRALIADAQAAEIDKQHGIEMWLAHHLASAWPRSGPLVEESGAAFGWDRAAGQLDESPAVAFLNNRLAAIAYVQQLDQPAHPLHHEWVELKTPGRKAFALMRKARVDKMQTLLGTIRAQYPEVEEYLSPQKVQDWTEPQQISKRSAWSWLFFIFFALSIVGRCSSSQPDSPSSNFVGAPFAEGWDDTRRSALIAEVFGSAAPGDLERLESDPRELWVQMRNVTSWDVADADPQRENLVNMMRNWTLLAAPFAEFEQLVAAKQVKLDLMRLARDGSGAEACLEVQRSGQLPAGVVVPPELRAREQAVLRAMHDAGMFDAAPEGEGAKQTDVPGVLWLVAMREAGLTPEQAGEAAAGEGPAEAQCDLRIALAGEVLKRPGEANAELLKIL